MRGVSRRVGESVACYNCPCFVFCALNQIRSQFTGQGTECPEAGLWRAAGEGQSDAHDGSSDEGGR